jgi:hypothetical protein
MGSTGDAFPALQESRKQGKFKKNNTSRNNII